MSETVNVCELALKMCELIEALGEAPINKHEGAWTRDLPDNWLLAANGHQEPFQILGFPLQPFEFAVWKNGWLAANFNAVGGVLLVEEDVIIEVIAAETRRVRGDG